MNDNIVIKQKKIKLLAVVGPTASGKTALAVRLAARLGGEVISCDSMQVYRGMDIGTAKPTADEMAGVPHHLIDIVEPREDFSVADYVLRAEAAVGAIITRGKLPIFCGGTGLYLDSFLRGSGFELTEGDEALRERLRREAAELGNEKMHARLAELDPESAAVIHPNNIRRVVRAIEIFILTGRKKSKLDRESREFESRYAPVIIGLRTENRDLLYRRIDERVDKMLADGLIDEVKRLHSAGVFETSRTASQAIGYKELLGVIDGRIGLTKAVEELKKSTRRYAKRQMTWFGANEAVRWIETDPLDIDAVTDIAVKIWEKCNLELK